MESKIGPHEEERGGGWAKRNKVFGELTGLVLGLGNLENPDTTVGYWSILDKASGKSVIEVARRLLDGLSRVYRNRNDFAGVWAISSEWVAASLCNFRHGIATNSTEYNQIQRANKCSRRVEGLDRIFLDQYDRPLLPEINVHEMFVRRCTVTAKVNLFSLAFPASVCLLLPLREIRNPSME